MRLGLDAGVHTLDLAVELGIRGVPISAEALVRDGVEATLAPLRKRDLCVCQIGAFGFNVLSTDRMRQARQHDILEAAIPLAAATGCRYVVICGGNYHPSGFGSGDARNFTDAALSETAAGLRPLVALAEQHGVRLCVEPYLKTAISSAERFLALWEQIRSPALCANLDVTSLYDYTDMWSPAATIQRTCEGLAGHYGLIHIKELALAEGFHIHIGLAQLGSGPTDWGEVLRLATPHAPEDSWIILEHIAAPEEGRASVAHLRAAAGRAGVILE